MYKHNENSIEPLPVRKDLRAKNIDYSLPGSYFITICTHNRKNILSRIVVDDEFDAVDFMSVGAIHDRPLLNRN